MSRKTARTRTPAEAREWLRANGVSITEWCRKHGLSRYTVHDLLRGQRKGHYGEAHRAAVALGLKSDPGGAQQ